MNDSIISNKFFDSIKTYSNEKDMVISFSKNEYYAVIDDNKYGPYETREQADKVKIEKRNAKNKQWLSMLQNK